MPLQEDSGVPRRAGQLPALRMWIAMLAVVAAALLLWLLLPDSPITVALLALALLAAVFTAVAWVLSARGVNRPPRRDQRRRT